MAGFITAEGLVVAAGGDTYDYVNDQRRLAGSIRSVVPAADRAGGDTIATAMSTDGRPVSATNPLFTYNQATRNLEWKDNTGWNLASQTQFVCNAVHGGSATGLQANLASGLTRPIIQAGSAVMGTDASGYFSFNYPITFPGGIMTIMLTSGDSGANGRGHIVAVAGNPPFAQTLSTCYGSIADGAGNPFTNSTIRIDYIVIGW